MIPRYIGTINPDRMAALVLMTGLNSDDEEKEQR
jgi:hypothetical protein